MRVWRLVLCCAVAAAGLVAALSRDAPATASATGYEWTQPFTEGGRWTAVATSADGMIAVAGLDFPTPAKVQITQDGGLSWAELAASPTALWSEIAVSQDAQMIVMTGTVSAQSSVWVSRNGGASFTAVLQAEDVEYRRFAMNADGSHLVVMSSGGVLVSTTSATTFVSPAALTSVVDGDVAITSDGQTMYVAHQGSHVWRSLDAGDSWSQLISAGTWFWTSFDVSANGQTVLGVVSYTQGAGVAARLSTDAGVTFNEVPGVAATFINQLASGGMSSNGQVMVATSYGSTPMVSGDGGQTWVSSDQPAGWLRFAISTDGSRLYGAIENGGIRLGTPLPPPPPAPSAPVVPDLDALSTNPDTEAPSPSEPTPSTEPPSSPEPVPEVVDEPAPQITAPTAAEVLQTPASDLGALPGSVIAGSVYDIEIGGFAPGEWVYVYVASEPVLVGSARADATGTVRMAIAVPTLSGQHSLVLFAPDSGVLVRQVVVIEAAELPRTGAPVVLLPLGLSLSLVGVLLLRSQELRRRSDRVTRLHGAA